MIVNGKPGLITDFCHALGFEDVLSLQINVPEEDVVTVTVTRIVKVDEFERLAKVARGYAIKATPIDPAQEPH